MFAGDEVAYRSVINYRLTRTASTGHLGDVMDGQLYKENFDATGHFTGTPAGNQHELHLSFQINTDGVALFKSSTFGVWPVYLAINELEPQLRYVFVIPGH